MYGHSGFQTTHEQLIAFAWSAPMRDLAARAGISDTGLRKLLRQCGVEPPPQGYWNKLQAGRPVPNPPAPSPRRPGCSPHVWMDERFRGLLEPAPRLSPDGPFASSLVPENLEELREQVLRAIGKVVVPRDLARPAAAFAKLLQREEKLAAKQAGPMGYLYDGPVFSGAFDRRRLRLANGLAHALAKRQVAMAVQLADDDFSLSFRVGNQHVGVLIDVATRRRKGSYDNPYLRRKERQTLEKSTPLGLWFLRYGEQPVASAPFADDNGGTLENKLAAIAAAIIVAGESAFRDSIRLELEHEQAERKRREELRLEHLRRAEAERLAALKQSGELLRQADEIRRLVAKVKAATTNTTLGLSSDELEAWEEWANAYADRIDPVKSGQVMAHLRRPEVD